MSHDKSCTRTYVPPADSAPCVSSPYRRVTVGRDPHAGKVVGVDFVLYELAPPFLVHVNAPRLSVVDLAAHHGGVGVGLHLEAGDAVPVDVTVLKVALREERGGEETNHCSGLLRPPANPGCRRCSPLPLTMPWSKVNTPTSRPWWMWLRLMMGLPWFFTQIPASALLLISLSS